MYHIEEPGEDAPFHERRDHKRLMMRLGGANISIAKGWDLSDLLPYAPDGGVDVVEAVQAWSDLTVVGDTIGGGTHAGQGLLLWGPPGHGKTTLASAALQDVLTRSQVHTWGPGRVRPYQPSRPAYMTYYRWFPLTLQKQFSGHTTEDEDKLLLDIQGNRSAESAIRLLVLDDVGKEHRTSSGWATGLFEGLIRDRYYQSWPTIITTNLAPTEWADTYGDSMSSFIKEAFAPIQVRAPKGDRR